MMRTSLAVATTMGNLAAVKRLLERGADVNAADEFSSPPLIGAARSGHEEMVRLLLEQEAEPRAITPHGGTALMLAAMGEDPEWKPPTPPGALTGLLTPERQAEVAANRATLRDRNLPVVRLLLDFGLDPNAVSENGGTALLYALLHGHAQVAALLRERGAQEGFLEAAAQGDLERADRLPLPEPANRPEQWGAPLLQWAARRERLDLLEFLLARGLSPNAANSQGQPLLMRAVMMRNFDMVQLLLGRGADPNGGEGARWVPLSWAANSEDPAMAKLLLEHGADVNRAGQHGGPPLMSAVMQGNPETARVLLEAGADPNRGEGNSSMPPLMFAMSLNKPELVKLLLEFGAEQSVGVKGMGAAELAALQNKPEVAAVLRAASGSDLPEAAKRRDTAEVTRLLDAGRDVNSRDEKGATALLRAAEAGNTELARYLLERDADANTADEHGFTPLAKAVQSGHAETSALLLAHGANPDTADRWGHTPLFRAVLGDKPELRDLLLKSGLKVGPLEAALLGDADTLRQLLDRGRDVDVPNVGGVTPLMAASAAGHREIAQSLLNRGADVNRQDGAGGTALGWAALHGQAKAASLLLDYGADPNLGSEINSPLDAAGRRPDLALMRLLLARGADVNRPGRFGTPLHRAVLPIEGYIEAVRVLLEAGADTEARDATLQQTPLIRACGFTKDNTDTVRLLLQHRANIHAKSAHGQTALGAAVSMHGVEGESKVETIRLLLEAGANPHEDERLSNAFGVMVPASLRSHPDLAALWKPFFAEEEEEEAELISLLGSIPDLSTSSGDGPPDITEALAQMKKLMGFSRE